VSGFEKLEGVLVLLVSISIEEWMNENKPNNWICCGHSERLEFGLWGVGSLGAAYFGVPLRFSKEKVAVNFGQNSLFFV